MVKKALILFGVMLLLVSSVSAITADYYFHPQCGHCEKIKPFMEQVSYFFEIEWLDASKASYDISGTPTLKIHPSDGGEIVLSGSVDIPKYSVCELNEMSTQDCVTYSADTCVEDTWFVR